MRWETATGHFRQKKVNLTGPTGRVVILMVATVMAGVLLGWMLPRVSMPFARLTGRYHATGNAAEALAGLAVEDEVSSAGYSRDVFGYRETDEDGNGCDVRDDVLAKDLTDVVYATRGGCVVKSGILEDPYTGTTIQFMRGRSTSSAVQIDHVVALQNAWQSGAKDWDHDKRLRYGNDPYNLLAVDGPANQDKGAASAAYWLPSNESFQCEYVARQIGVKAKYGLTVTSAEQRAMLTILHGCPGQALPSE
ncbi:MAG: HNH endonuclease family protein [Bifidobacterium sp.]|nr:HNH endonuclease family protein [Bifidobacterium sp.]